jgi:hypothetical protein
MPIITHMCTKAVGKHAPRVLAASAAEKRALASSAWDVEAQGMRMRLGARILWEFDMAMDACASTLGVGGCLSSSILCGARAEMIRRRRRRAAAR